MFIFTKQQLQTNKSETQDIKHQRKIYINLDRWTISLKNKTI